MERAFPFHLGQMQPQTRLWKPRPWSIPAFALASVWGIFTTNLTPATPASTTSLDLIHDAKYCCRFPIRLSIFSRDRYEWYAAHELQCLAGPEAVGMQFTRPLAYALG